MSQEAIPDAIRFLKTQCQGIADMLKQTLKALDEVQPKLKNKEDFAKNRRNSLENRIKGNLEKVYDLAKRTGNLSANNEIHSF